MSKSPPYYPPKPIRAWADSNLHQQLIEDPNYIVEPKYNGDRCIVVWDADGCQLWSRHGRLVRYSWLQDLVKELEAWDMPAGVILDCELCAEPKPRQDLYVFDIPSAGGELSHRKKLLTELCKEIKGAKHIHLVKPYKNKKEAYQKSLVEGHEGVVWKRLDSKYSWQLGTTNNEVSDWIKMKPSQVFEGAVGVR